MMNERSLDSSSESAYRTLFDVVRAEQLRNFIDNKEPLNFHGETLTPRVAEWTSRRSATAFSVFEDGNDRYEVHSVVVMPSLAVRALNRVRREPNMGRAHHSVYRQTTVLPDNVRPLFR